MSECDVEEILKQIRVLDSLKQLRDNMGESFFLNTFPELSGVSGKLESVIEKQEEELNTKMSECGNLNIDEAAAELSAIEEPVPDLELPDTESILESELVV
jgi:hypothetical protein